MASTSTNLEQGYEKILRYLSNEFRQVGRDTQLEVSGQMREAVQRLRKRPELLTYVLLSFPILDFILNHSMSQRSLGRSL